jgi:hypothetical protein
MIRRNNIAPAPLWTSNPLWGWLVGLGLALPLFITRVLRFSLHKILVLSQQKTSAIIINITLILVYFLPCPLHPATVSYRLFRRLTIVNYRLFRRLKAFWTQAKPLRPLPQGSGNVQRCPLGSTLGNLKAPNRNEQVQRRAGSITANTASNPSNPTPTPSRLPSATTC